MKILYLYGGGVEVQLLMMKNSKILVVHELRKYLNKVRNNNGNKKF